MDPSKKSYTSIASLDMTEDTSLPLNPQLHRLLLTEVGITDIQACKAALSRMIKLSWIYSLKNGRKVPARKSHM